MTSVKLERPAVAVIIAAYNAQDTIVRAITSALSDVNVARVIVADDGSTDETCAISQAQDDHRGRLAVLRLGANGGPAAARNAALARVIDDVDWVCALDADDYFMPGRLGRLLAVAGDWEMVADTLITAPCQAAPPLPPRLDLTGRQIDLEAFVTGNISQPGRTRGEMGFVKPIIRTAFLRQHRLAYSQAMRLGEDYDLYARALALGARMVLTGPQGYVAAVRDDSLSAVHSVHDLQRLRDCDRAISSLRPMTAAELRAFKRHTISVDCRLQWRLMINAVKKRDALAFVRTFRSTPVTFYLLARLAEQLRLRSTATLKRRAPTAVRVRGGRDIVDRNRSAAA